MKKNLGVFVLVLICLVVSSALAVGNMLTQPVIDSAAVERAERTRMEIIPYADGFEPISISGLPKTVTDVYSSTNEVGYIFVVTTSGYGGAIEIMCGIDPDGKIIKTTTLKQTETKGLGTLVFDREGEYEGKDENLDGIDAVSGATITSNAYKNGIRDAFEAFNLVKEAGK